MGNTAAGRSIKGAAECCWSPRATDKAGNDEREEELAAAAERDRLLDYADETDASKRAHLSRFYSCHEIVELDSFIERYGDVAKGVALQPVGGRRHTLIGAGFGTWGISSMAGGDFNAWHDIDGCTYQVRGRSYLSDRYKEASANSLCDLAVVDLFFSNTDIGQASVSEEAKTVQRLRREGEERRLFVLNFRLVPLHVVIVWALPPKGGTRSSGTALLNRFYEHMGDEERRKRLKVIPRVNGGPWLVRKAIGENKPAILGRNIPIDFHAGDNVLEASVGVAASSAGQRVTRMLLRAAGELDIEVAVVLEGQEAEELPEQVLGGFRVTHPDFENVRTVDPDSEEEEDEGGNATKSEQIRPTFLGAEA